MSDKGNTRLDCLSSSSRIYPVSFSDFVLSSVFLIDLLDYWRSFVHWLSWISDHVLSVFLHFDLQLVPTFHFRPMPLLSAPQFSVYLNPPSTPPSRFPSWQYDSMSRMTSPFEYKRWFGWLVVAWVWLFRYFLGIVSSFLTSSKVSMPLERRYWFPVIDFSQIDLIFRFPSIPFVSPWLISDAAFHQLSASSSSAFNFCGWAFRFLHQFCVLASLIAHLTNFSRATRARIWLWKAIEISGHLTWFHTFECLGYFGLDVLPVNLSLFQRTAADAFLRAVTLIPHVQMITIDDTTAIRHFVLAFCSRFSTFHKCRFCSVWHHVAAAPTQLLFRPWLIITILSPFSWDSFPFWVGTSAVTLGGFPWGLLLPPLLNDKDLRIFSVWMLLWGYFCEDVALRIFLWDVALRILPWDVLGLCFWDPLALIWSLRLFGLTSGINLHDFRVRTFALDLTCLYLEFRFACDLLSGTSVFF